VSIHRGTRDKRKKVKKVLSVALGALALAVGSETAASAANDAPVVTQTAATFRIPAGGQSEWQLSLWSSGRLLGRVSATSGVLRLAVPSLPGCVFQADVRNGAPGRLSFYSGVQRRLPACGAPRARTAAVSTRASGAALGASVSDVAVLSGASSDAEGTITFDAYGPRDPACAAAAVFVRQVPVAGPGTYGPVSFTPSQGVGAYHWTARYSGDAGNRPAAEACGAPDETSDLTAASHSGANTRPPAPTPATAAAQSSGPTDSPIAGATSVHTGEPWSGSAPYAAATAGTGSLLTGTGLLRRRRARARCAHGPGRAARMAPGALRAWPRARCAHGGAPVARLA